jgi:hypothetical protein
MPLSSVRDVLLMLSSGHDPDPRDEILWHAERWATTGEPTAIATTHPPSMLRRDQSIVAFYGSADLANCLLANGVFAGYVSRDTTGGRALEAVGLYARGNLPEGTKGFIKVRDFHAAAAGEPIDSLEGVIESSGLPLTLANLPNGPARAQVYFRRRK